MKKEYSQTLKCLNQKTKPKTELPKEKPSNWNELIALFLANRHLDLQMPRRQIRELRDPFDGFNHN